MRASVCVEVLIHSLRNWICLGFGLGQSQAPFARSRFESGLELWVELLSFAARRLSVCVCMLTQWAACVRFVVLCARSRAKVSARRPSQQLHSTQQLLTHRESRCWSMLAADPRQLENKQLQLPLTRCLPSQCCLEVGNWKIHYLKQNALLKCSVKVLPFPKIPWQDASYKNQSDLWKLEKHNTFTKFWQKI